MQARIWPKGGHLLVCIICMAPFNLCMSVRISEPWATHSKQLIGHKFCVVCGGNLFIGDGVYPPRGGGGGPSLGNGSPRGGGGPSSLGGGGGHGGGGGRYAHPLPLVFEDMLSKIPLRTRLKLDPGQGLVHKEQRAGVHSQRIEGPQLVMFRCHPPQSPEVLAQARPPTATQAGTRDRTADRQDCMICLLGLAPQATAWGPGPMRASLFNIVLPPSGVTPPTHNDQRTLAKPVLRPFDVFFFHPIRPLAAWGEGGRASWEAGAPSPTGRTSAFRHKHTHTRGTQRSLHGHTHTCLLIPTLRASGASGLWRKNHPPSHGQARYQTLATIPFLAYVLCLRVLLSHWGWGWHTPSKWQGICTC